MPDWKEEIGSRLAKLNLDPAKEAGIIDELADHAADRYQELVRQGVAPANAYRQALEELADSRLPDGILEAEATPKALFSRRFPFAARILMKHWKLTAVAVLSLAMAMAASVAGLSVMNALLWRLPMAAAPGQLVTLHDSSPADPFQQMSFPEYKYYR